MRTAAYALGLLVSLAQPAGAQSLPAPPASPLPLVNYEYDANGNLSRSIVAPGFATSRTYWPLDRLKDVTDARGGVTSLQYNGHSDITRVTDPRLLPTGYQRNGFGEVTRVSSPDTGVATLSYDPAGKLRTHTHNPGVQSIHTYDALNRLTSVVHSKNGQVSQGFGWRYDETGSGFGNGVGRLTSTAHPSGSTQYSYDAQGRVVSDTQRVDAATGANPAQFVATVSYGYDPAGNLTSIGYPSGRVLTIVRAGGLPTVLMLAAGNTAAPIGLVSEIEWEPFGAARSWKWWTASGLVPHTRLFDQAGRLVRYRLGNVWRDLAYDAADRISSYTHYDTSTGAPVASRNQYFGYDELGRLTQASMGNATWNYGYDANGNRLGDVRNGTASTYVTAGTSNRLLSTTNPSRSFAYDTAGHVTADGANNTATYDLAGRLATLFNAATMTTTMYSVDGFGRRVRKFSSTGTSTALLFVYDQGGRLLGEYRSTGAPVREYVWLGDTPLAMFTPNPADPAGAPQIFHIHADHLDAPRAALDTNGGIRWLWMAEPFGTTAASSNPYGLGPLTIPLRFPGQYFDTESGLMYNWHREYDAMIGRYGQSDPIGLAGGINTYAYVGGNPISYVDEDGLNPRAIQMSFNAGYRVGEAINPYFQPYIASAVDAVMFPTLPDSVLLAQNNKQTRKRIDGLQKQLDLHKKKLDKDPQCEAANHWRNEISTWQSEVDRLRLRLPNGQ